MKDIKIPSSKGNIEATVHPAKSKKLAILCPGFLDSKDYTGLRELAKRLNEEDYSVVRFNPIGVWGSGGTIKDYNTTEYLKNIRTVLEYMLEENDYKYILIGGHSRGGQMSLLYASQDSRINLALGIMPSTGPYTGERRENWENNGYIGTRDLPFEREKTIEYDVPFSHLLDHNKYNIMEDIKKIKIPILIIAGEADEIIPIEKIKGLYNNANQPKTFIPIPNIGHDYRLNDEEVATVNQKIIEKLKETPDF